MDDKMTNKQFADRILDTIMLVGGDDCPIKPCDVNPRQAGKFRRKAGKVWRAYRMMSADKKEEIKRRCGFFQAH